MTSALVIHSACVGLVVLNLIARTWRTQLIFVGLGEPMPFLEVATANLAGDTAAALTPMRAGGIPAQVAFFQRVGTRPALTVPTLLVESILLYPAYAFCVGLLALSAGLEWFQLMGSAVASAGRALPVVAGACVVGWLLILIVRRAAPHRTRAMGQSLREGLTMVRRMRRGPALLTLPLTVIDVATRVALLPVLSLNVPGAPPADVLALASFALLYGQLLMPTPGGAGLVEYGMLGGAAGDLGDGAGAITFWWRVYTAGLHMAACAPMIWWRLSTRVAKRRPEVAAAPHATR